MSRIYPHQLQSADVLLKRITGNAALLSRAIGVGEKVHLRVFAPGQRQVIRNDFGIDPTRFSHAALAMGPDELLEFDEGSGIVEIMKFKGEGVVHTTGITARTHGGNEYVVFRCRDRDLADRTYHNARIVQTCWQSVRGASYGIRKLVNSSLFGRRGESINDEKIRKELEKLKGQQHSWFRTNRANFFCSQFVAFVYLWAAHELAKEHRFPGITDLFGIDKARISPAELCVRMLNHGYFNIAGEMFVR